VVTILMEDMLHNCHGFSTPSEIASLQDLFGKDLQSLDGA
jgi:hypothetical protein